MTRTVEHDRRHVVHAPAEALGDRANVLLDRLQEVDRATSARTDGDLAHIHVRETHQRTGIAHGDHRHRPVPSARNDTAALERIDCEVDRFAARAEHAAPKRRVLVRRADDDVAADRKGVQHVTHRLGGIAFRGLVVRAPEPASAGERRPLRHARVAFAETEALALRLGNLLERRLDRLSQRSAPPRPGRRRARSRV